MTQPISSLKQQTAALVSQAATVDHQTLNKADRSAFRNTVELVKGTVDERLREISQQLRFLGSRSAPLSPQQEQRKSSLTNDHGEIVQLSTTLSNLEHEFGTTACQVKHAATGKTAEIELINGTTTAKDLKIAAANALQLPIESIKIVIAPLREVLYDHDDRLIANRFQSNEIFYVISGRVLEYN